VYIVKNLTLTLFLITFLVGCGVETSSSSNSDTTSGTTSGIDSTDENSTDENSTTDSVDITPTGSNSGFDTKDALYDENACSLDTGFNVISDSSFDPVSTADIDNGLEINSAYPYTADLEATKVALYYPTFTQELSGQFVNVYATQYYRFSFDKSWLDNSDKKIYIRPPKGDALYYGCYRFELNSLDAGTIIGTKVFR